jgi:hypothetical protein
MISRSESMNYVTSCHQVESTVLTAQIEKVWEILKSFNFHKFLSTHVKNTKFTSGSAVEVGSVFEIEYADGSVWTFRIIELSELRHVIAYELISANPSIDFTSMVTFIKLLKVTDGNHTYVSWETDFSNDINSHIVQDQKFKKLEYFKELKTQFSK